MAREKRFVREAILQEPAGDGVRCRACRRTCLIPEGGTGWCRTRRVEGGVLHTLIYGAVSSLSVNPAEKKPFFHFYPGSYYLTSGSWSCNFACPWCQNHSLSKTPPGGGEFLSPDEIVEIAAREGCHGTSPSLNEPTLSLEWVIEVFRLARARGMKNTFVTNGYMTADALRLLREAGLDAMNTDVKGSAGPVRRFCEVEVEGVWDTLNLARSLSIHLEITTLVIPGVNDDEESLRSIAHRIRADLGQNIPWHVTRYHPAYGFRAPPTPVKTLEGARKIGTDAGLEYVYLGNVPDHPYENTYCPDCGEPLIIRSGLSVVETRLRGNACPRCGRTVPVVG